MREGIFAREDILQGLLGKEYYGLTGKRNAINCQPNIIKYSHLHALFSDSMTK